MSPQAICTAPQVSPPDGQLTGLLAASELSVPPQSLSTPLNILKGQTGVPESGAPRAADGDRAERFGPGVSRAGG